MISVRFLSVGPIMALLVSNGLLALSTAAPMAGWPMPDEALVLILVTGGLSSVFAIGLAVAHERQVTAPLKALARQATAIGQGVWQLPVHIASETVELVALAAAIETLRHAAVKVSALDAQTEAEIAHRAEILRTLDRPLRQLECGAATLCDLSRAAAIQLGNAAGRLVQLGPEGADAAEPLAEAAVSVTAEGVAMLTVRDRMTETIQAMRIAPDHADDVGQERRSSEILRMQAADLFEIVSCFSVIVGRINRPSLTAMGCVVADQQRLGTPTLIRELSDQIAGAAEDLGREVGVLHGALRDVVVALERLARRPAADSPAISLIEPVELPLNAAA